MNYKVRCGSKRHSIEVPNNADLHQPTSFNLGKQSYSVKVNSQTEGGDIKAVSVNNKLYSVKIRRRPDGFPYKVILNGRAYTVELERVESTRFRPPAPERKVDSTICALLPGQVSRLLVTKGQKIKQGETLLVLEAMKMENEITSPMDGVVRAIQVKEGDVVSKGHLLLELQAE